MFLFDLDIFASRLTVQFRGLISSGTRIIAITLISQIRLCEGRSLACPDLLTHGWGTPIRALLYSLVLTLCTRRLCWLELFVMDLKDVNPAESLGLSVRFR